MAEKDEVKLSSLIARTLKDTGEFVDWAGSAVPYGSLFGKALKTIPWQDLFDWAELAYKRYHGSEPAPPPGDTEVAVSPADSASTAARAMAELVRSDPFGLAVDEAMAGFPKLLTDFISRTESAGTGIWPAFSFEQLARLHFRRELGASASASVPEVAELVQKGLASDVLRQLQADVQNAQDRTPPGVPLRRGGWVNFLWKVDPSFVWPKIGDLNPGYFAGFHTVLDFFPKEVQQAKEQEKQLLAQFGRMSEREREHLSETWLSQCDAMIASRKWEPLDQNLALMKMPLFSALLALEKRGIAVDDVRPKLEKMVAAVKNLGSAPADTVGVLSDANSMLEAVADDDLSKFRSSAGRLQKEIKSNSHFSLRAKTNVPTIEEGISAISKGTGWIPMAG